MLGSQRPSLDDTSLWEELWGGTALALFPSCCGGMDGASLYQGNGPSPTPT